MAQDVNKQLERARRSLEKNKLREAVGEYQAILDDVPSNQEALQALADIYTRLNEPALAVPYYAAHFDRLIEVGDAAKASAIFTRFLRSFPQPPDRLMRYATMLQRQNRPSESIEHFSAAAELYQQQHRDVEALACRESIALLEPENPERHVTLGELAEHLRHADLASRSFLRAGQLTIARGVLDDALEYFSRAHRLLPGDRTAALLFADAKLRKGDAEGAVEILDPFSPSEKDTAFLSLFGESLLRTGRLDRSREVLETCYREKPDNCGKLFELTGAYIRAGEDEKASSLLVQIKEWMRKVRKEGELAAQMDRLAAAYPASLPLAETVAHTYEDLNRETKYFEALVRLYDLYLAAGRMQEARDALDRLVDIDPYDWRNHERIAKLEGKVDPAFLESILARAAKASTVSAGGDGFTGTGEDGSAAVGSVPEEVRSQQALEDLIVQVEIFLQYSLQAKAVERLERLAELYPGEEENNERLHSLYERANWWPKGAPPKAQSKPVSAALTAVPLSAPAGIPAAPASPSPSETHRDLTAIAEISRLMYRQPSPSEVLATTAAAIARHLGVSRCMVAIGTSGEEAQLTAEYFGPGATAAGTAAMASIVGMISKASPDAHGGIELRASSAPGLRELSLESALGVMLTDKETQAPSGALLVGDASPRSWMANESFFLQTVGDQLVLSVSHTKLRSLVRSLAVTDEKTGVLSRVAYIDCLLIESNRARTQGSSLSLIILEIDRGADLLRQVGDQAFEQYIDELARALRAAIRQTDVTVKYTAWSLLFILPGTSIESAQLLAEKLRQTALAVRPSWGPQELTVSAVVAQSSSRRGDDAEDRVTELINRVEAGLDELRQTSGNALVPLATP
ncbi:MAG TPA: tetratricopeptide repeat protein [Verrucomicrobiae bacterium]|jgi:diguanylate cyclase (GGDEF)-like protein|nr:tetratricopeptide repeat protein [Verrucomicrobiae bacterium]